MSEAESEREALANLIEATSTEWEADFKAEGIRIGNHADFVANRLIASGFRRLPEPGGIDLDAIRTRFADWSAADAWNRMNPSENTNTLSHSIIREDIPALLAEIIKMYKDEQEIRREACPEGGEHEIVTSSLAGPVIYRCLNCNAPFDGFGTDAKRLPDEEWERAYGSDRASRALQVLRNSRLALGQKTAQARSILEGWDERG